MSGEPIPVRVEPELEDIVPIFLERRRQEVQRLREHLAQGDYEAIALAGHSMKGTGGGYGFTAISEMGARLERAGKEGDADAVTGLIAELADYLGRIELVYD